MWCIRCSAPVVTVCSALALAGMCAAQETPPPATDPAALKAFTELVKSYRDRPGLTVKTTLKVGGENAGAAATGQELHAEFTFGPHRAAVVKLRGYTCYLSSTPSTDPDEPAQGVLSSIHEKNDSAYFTMPDDGSPYYALMSVFIDIPFPELAIELGEDSMEDVLMQFHPRAPSVVPTAVTVEDKDSKKLQHITLSSDTDTIDIVSDPATHLIQTIDLKIGGGDAVQPGTSLTYSYAYTYETVDKPFDPATFVLDPKDRQRVDVMTALAPRAPGEDPNAPGADENEAPQPSALVGKPAPTFTLMTADGKAVDLDKLHGRVVVLDFWATWCGPCRAALPLLHQVAKWAADGELPVSVYTVNVWEIRDPQKDSPDARLASAKAFWEKQGFTLPIVMDYSDETAKAYGVQGIPTGVIIRSDGIVHAVHVGGGADYIETMKHEIQEAIDAVEAKK